MNTIKSLTRKPSPEVINQNMMGLIRKVHGMIDRPDIEKHRLSQDHVGTLLGNSKDVLIRSVKIEDMMGEWVSVNRAHMKKYVILYCHGGGYSTGSRLYARTLTTKLALSTSMDVLCFDYRLAPEHPYPAAMEDAMRAWNYLMLLGYGARDVVIAGDSAGGNMAVSLVLKLKEQERLLPRGLVLMSPWTDLTSQGITHRTKAEVDPVLDAAYLERMITNYVKGQDGKEETEKKTDIIQTTEENIRQSEKKTNMPCEEAGLFAEAAQAEKTENAVSVIPSMELREPAELKVKNFVDLKNPMISPIYGSFAGFPPTYIQVGENEVLLSDSTMLHKKMVKENVSVKIDIFKGMWHVFQMSPLKIAHDAMEKNAEFIFDICR